MFRMFRMFRTGADPVIPVLPGRGPRRRSMAQHNVGAPIERLAGDDKYLLIVADYFTKWRHSPYKIKKPARENCEQSCMLVWSNSFLTL
jgi:hypothetical protein